MVALNPLICRLSLDSALVVHFTKTNDAGMTVEEIGQIVGSASRHRENDKFLVSHPCIEHHFPKLPKRLAEYSTKMNSGCLLVY